jgi:hypothetical protein
MEWGDQVLPARLAWQRLRYMQQVVAQQPRVAYAMQWLPIYDQLELTLELLAQTDWPDLDQPEPPPPNVVRFRPRQAR